MKSLDTQNITLAVPRDVLHRVKLLAVEKRSSVSRLLVEQLEALLNQTDEYERAHKRYRARMKRLPDLGTGGKATWTRDDLHER